MWIPVWTKQPSSMSGPPRLPQQQDRLGGGALALTCLAWEVTYSTCTHSPVAPTNPKGSWVGLFPKAKTGARMWVCLGGEPGSTGREWRNKATRMSRQLPWAPWAQLCLEFLGRLGRTRPRVVLQRVKETMLCIHLVPTISGWRLLLGLRNSMCKGHHDIDWCVQVLKWRVVWSLECPGEG